jgi:16S rRNA processing protein RimM
MVRPEWIEVGRVSRPHGVHGEVRIVPSTDNPERFTADSVLYARPGRAGVAGRPLQDQTRLTISTVRGNEGFPILKFGEVLDRDSAEALRGCILEIRSSQLPELDEDEFYAFDLIGLEVRDESGVTIGRVTDVVDSPAHPLLVVTSGSGPRDAAPDGSARNGELVPFVTAAVPVVVLDSGYLVVASGFMKGLEAPEGPAQQPGVDSA